MKSRKRSDRAAKSKNKLLDIFVKVRTYKALDRVLDRSKDYQKALRQQDVAFERLARAGLSQAQKIIVDKAISANNDCGAVYGVVAYRLGFCDGVKLISELEEIR